jgi:FkbM family methyltransferase
LFSFTFLVRSARLAIKYRVFSLSPTAFASAIDERRKAEWDLVKRHYATKPAKVAGLRIFVNPADPSWLSSSIASTGWYEPALTELLRKVLKPGMTVVDVGANIGYFSLISAKIVGSSGSVVAFEPEAGNCGLFEASLAANAEVLGGIVKLRRAAVSDGSDHATLFLNPSLPTHHSTADDHFAGSIRVDCVRLDDLQGDPDLRNRVDLVKVHVVGEEASVIAGGLGLIRKFRPRLIFVYMPSRWRGREPILGALWHDYDFHEVVRTPFLVRRLREAELRSGRNLELYLVPKGRDARPLY